MNNNYNLFHVSEEDLSCKILIPRIPKNCWLIDNGYEDNKTSRICVAKSIDDCLTAIGDDIKDMIFNVYALEKVDEDLIVKKPTKEEVPDVEVTNELWVLNKAKCKFLYKIKVCSIIKELNYTLDNEIYSAWKWDYKII